jgi:hypothetical protein
MDIQSIITSNPEKKFSFFSSLNRRCCELTVVTVENELPAGVVLDRQTCIYLPQTLCQAVKKRGVDCNEHCTYGLR